MDDYGDETSGGHGGAPARTSDSGGVWTVFVDYNRIGSSTSFRVPLSRAERDGLQVGDTVALTGDPDMPQQQATVMELTADGYAVLQRYGEGRPSP